MNETLFLIVSLGEIDTRIDTARKELENLPLQISKKFNELKTLQEELENIKTRLEETKRQRIRKERNLEETQSLLNKYQKQLFEVKTNEEYTAILKEIDNTRNDISVLEDEVIMLLEEIDNYEESIKKLEGSIESKRRDVNAFRDFSKQRENELKKTIDELTIERERLAGRIDKMILSRYERTREHNQGRATAIVVDGVCQNCFVNLPPQLVNRVILGETVERCPNCACYLYHKDDEEHKDE